MLCPRCNKNTLQEREKDGVTIDICQECRGIWLDRGELERLIARATQEMDRQDDVHGSPNAYQKSSHDHYDKHDGDHDRHYDEHHKHPSYGEHHGHEGKHHRKRHWLAELFD
jgi:uncharacterized protein